MENLIQLVKSLKKSEISFIQHYYKNDTDKKRLKLFNWVLDGKVKTDDEAANKLYGGKGPAYSHLKSRLLNDLMNLLLFEEGSRQSESELFQNEVDVLRSILIGKILFVRKVHDLGIKQWQSAIATSTDYEMYTEKILAKSILSSSIGIREGIEAYDRSSSDLDIDISFQNNLIFAEKLYFSVALPNTFYKNNQDEFVRLARAGMIKLEKMYNETPSSKIGYYYFLIAINYFSIIRDFESLNDFSLRFLELVKNNKSVRSRARLVNAYMQAYAGSMHLKRYQEAYYYSVKSIDYTVKGGANELTVYEYQFLALLRFSVSEEIRNVFKNVESNRVLLSSSINKGKWIFYKAVYFFVTKKFNDSLFELQKENALLKDKSGWLFGHKLLEIMCYVEMDEFDMIDFRIESLRKLLQRQKHKNITRIKSIFNVLNTLVKTGYNFKSTYKKEAEIFQLLSESKDEYFWDPLGYELIRFDDWFRSKI